MYITRKILHLLLPAFLPVVLAVFTAGAQSVYPGTITELSVEELPGVTYTWDVYNDSTVNFATEDGTAVDDDDAQFITSSSGPTVQVRWLSPGVYFYKVTATDSCTNNLKIGRMEVLKALPTAELELNPTEVCVNDSSELVVTLTGDPVWKFTLKAEDEDGSAETEYTVKNPDDNPFILVVSPSKTTTYTVVRVTDPNGEQLEPSNTVVLTVNPLPRSSRIYVKKL